MKLLKWTAPLAAALLLAACGAEEQEKEISAQQKETGYSVTDDRGVAVAFDAVPKTIVSLQPSNTEILFDLGVGEQIVGATDYDTYPEAAQKIERVSDSVAINAERIIELQPDVVIAYTNGDENQVKQLEDAGLDVFVIASATNFEDVYGDVAQLAEVFQVEKQGEVLVKDIQAQITAVEEKVATLETKKKAYFEIAPAPDIWSAGSGTFQQEILATAGVDNIYADQQSWFSVASEDVVAKNPPIILSTVNYVEDPIGEIKARQGWQDVTAIKNDAIHVLDPDILSRPATRIGDAVEIVAETVYPELFK